MTMKLAQERLVVVHPDGAVDEFFEGFFRAFEGNPALMNNLAELDLYVRQYKNVSYTHHASAVGYDYAGPRWVQVKTTSNPSTSGHIAAMKTAIDDLVRLSPADAQLTLHILRKPGTDSELLRTSLQDYVELKPYEDRINIVIEAYDLGPQ